MTAAGTHGQAGGPVPDANGGLGSARQILAVRRKGQDPYHTGHLVTGKFLAGHRIPETNGRADANGPVYAGGQYGPVGREGEAGGPAGTAGQGARPLAGGRV